MKSDVAFPLADAPWPALMVDVAGLIQHANAPSRRFFAANVVDGVTRFAALWSAQNDTTADQFLSKAQRGAGPVAVKFLLKTGVTATCATFISPTNVEFGTSYLVQILPGQSSGQGGGTTMIAASAVDAGLAQKQKLDCALQLTRTVALDFNNALTSILGHTSHVLSLMEPNHPWRNSLLQVEKSGQKAAEIAHDLAAFSRQEKDNKVQVTGNLNDLLRRVVELFQGQHEKIEWKLNLEGTPYTATFDEAKMQQAIVKILENATQAGGTRVVVLSRNRDIDEPTQDGTLKLAAGCYVCIEITDNGCGIAAEVLPRIFEPFFTTKQGHRGLGLAWVYGIITNHGGSLAVTGQPGTGATARIYLPAQRKVMRDKKLRDDELRGTETILIVDDEDLLLTLGQMVLASAGYTVLTANSGEKALEILSRPGVRVDLVITDMVMPNMSGRELIERLRVLKPQIKIICSSGYMRAAGRDEDDETYLQKPFTSQDMLLKVKRLLLKK